MHEIIIQSRHYGKKCEMDLLIWLTLMYLLDNI